MLTTQALVERLLAAHGERTAVVDANRTLTYRDLRSRSARLANVLRAAGADGERPAAVLLPNNSLFVEFDLACMRAGITRVGIGTRLSADECQYILEHSGAVALLTTPELYDRIDTAKLRQLKRVLLVGDTRAHGSAGGLEHDYEDALRTASSTMSSTAPVAPEHPAYVLYTSGTTGRPKGATHTHGGRVAAMLNMLACEIRADHSSTMVHCAPLTHGSGSKLLTFLAIGACNLILPRFEPGEFARAVEQHRATHSFMVPTMLQMLLDAGAPVQQAVRSMQQISFGGAPITDALFARALEGFGPRLTQVYGSCEAPHPVTVLQTDDYRSLADPAPMARTCGRTSHGSETMIVDETGAALGAGEEGELWVRGPHLMSHYWRDDNATREVFAPGGWYMTGDIALIDDAAFVYLRDRKRDLIITGGLNVYPSEVERVLAEHPAVKEVAVIGYPDERWGEGIMACVVTRPDVAAPSAEALTDWVGTYLAGYKRPRQVLFMNELPKGSTNKVLKRELKARFWAGRDRRIN